MSMAIIVQTETNTTNGGTMDGFLSGSSSASANTFYGRRLTNMWVNESFSGTPTVNAFSPSTGGSGAASTAGQFTLVPGTYRIFVDASYRLGAESGASVIFGLYNVTSGVFEVYSGSSPPEPIIGTVLAAGDSNIRMATVRLSAIITVSTSNKTYQISQEASSTVQARSLSVCGIATGMTGANVNGAAAKNTYCIVKIIRTA